MGFITHMWRSVCSSGYESVCGVIHRATTDTPLPIARAKVDRQQSCELRCTGTLPPSEPPKSFGSARNGTGLNWPEPVGENLPTRRSGDLQTWSHCGKGNAGEWDHQENAGSSSMPFEMLRMTKIAQNRDLVSPDASSTFLKDPTWTSSSWCVFVRLTASSSNS